MSILLVGRLQLNKSKQCKQSGDYLRFCPEFVDCFLRCVDFVVNRDSGSGSGPGASSWSFPASISSASSVSSLITVAALLRRFVAAAGCLRGTTTWGSSSSSSSVTISKDKLALAGVNPLGRLTIPAVACACDCGDAISGRALMTCMPQPPSWKLKNILVLNETRRLIND